MATLAECEARIDKADAAIREREARGRTVPDSWLEAYEAAWAELLATWATEQRAPLVQHHRLPSIR